MLVSARAVVLLNIQSEGDCEDPRKSPNDWEKERKKPPAEYNL